MKAKYVKIFLIRGLIFGGFGPIILGIIYYIISIFNKDLVFSGAEVMLSITSVYLLAFAHAGASVFQQIDEWSVAKSTLIHFAVLYVTYVSCYLLNRWIPFDWLVLCIFTGVFVAIYFFVWLTVVLILKKVSKKLNNNLKSN